MRALLLLVASGGCQLVFPLAAGDDGIEPADTWRAVSAGLGHTCALDVDGRLFCWGRNLDGETGRMGPGELAAIREVGTASERWLSVTTSSRHTCGIKADGTSWCWGANGHGQLGSDVPSSAEPIATSIGATYAIAASERHTCAITEDRSISCWGANSVGELGNGLVEDSAMPVVVASDLTFEAIAVGTTDRTLGTSCGIAADRTLWCWGQVLGASGRLATPTQLGTDTWKKIALGNGHGCGITEAGTMRCWGLNSAGQLGNGTFDASVTPVGAVIDNEDRTDWTEVAVGSQHSCGIAGGTWFCWGSSATGQLGLDGLAKNPTPVELGAGTQWQALGAGDGHTCAVAADRTLWCVGRRGSAQLGDGSSSRSTPFKLGGRWRSVEVGLVNTCGIDFEAHVQCTGGNEFGTIGDGTTDGRQRHALIDQSTGWSVINPGAFHSCGVLFGNVKCWGGDYAGQSTGVKSGPKLVPTAPTPAVKTTFVSVNGEHSCAWTNTSQAAVCWGANYNGQLGNNDVADVGPVAPVAASNFTVIDTGRQHTCGIGTDARVKCWGSGQDGRLGRAQAGNTGAPVSISFDHQFELLSVGDGSSCAIDAEQAMYCWGTNYGGELGLGDQSSRVTPGQVAGSWSAVAVGATHACGLQGADLFCWGSNDHGQLGSGTLVESLTPESVASEGGWKRVAVGTNATCAIDSADALWCWGDNSQGQLGTGDAWSITPVQVIAK